MSFTLCSSGAIINKAGIYANSDITDDDVVLAEWCDQAEGQIVSETRRDWVNNIDDAASGVQFALANACSALAAMEVIATDMSGYTSGTEAQTMLDRLKDSSRTIISALKDFDSNEIKDPS